MLIETLGVFIKKVGKEVYRSLSNDDNELEITMGYPEEPPVSDIIKIGHLDDNDIQKN